MVYGTIPFTSSAAATERSFKRGLIPQPHALRYTVLRTRTEGFHEQTKERKIGLRKMKKEI